MAATGLVDSIRTYHERQAAKVGSRTAAGAAMGKVRKDVGDLSSNRDMQPARFAHTYASMLFGSATRSGERIGPWWG
jgi:hypothetical protein